MLLKPKINNDLFQFLLNFLEEHPTSFVGGSFSLSFFGLIDREIYDVDISINKKHKNIVLNKINNIVSDKISTLNLQNNLYKVPVPKRMKYGFAGETLHIGIDNNVYFGVSFLDNLHRVYIHKTNEFECRLLLPDEIIKWKCDVVNEYNGFDKEKKQMLGHKLKFQKHNNDLKVIEKNKHKLKMINYDNVILL